MKSPGRALLTTFSMIPAMMLPMNVVDDRAIAALSKIPIRLSSCPRTASLIGNATIMASMPANVSDSMISWNRNCASESFFQRRERNQLAAARMTVTAARVPSTGKKRVTISR